MLAAVEFNEESDASKALQSLAYSKFGRSILYIEKAPANIWTIDPNLRMDHDDLKAEKPEDANVQRGPVTLFVKNLSFATSTTALQDAMKHTKGYRHAHAVNQQNDTGGRSKGAGYGFIEYESRELAVEAAHLLDGFMLDGHDLKISLAEKNFEADLLETSPQTTAESHCKLVIKNLPFETSKLELRSLLRSGLSNYQNSAVEPLITVSTAVFDPYGFLAKVTVLREGMPSFNITTSTRWRLQYEVYSTRIY